MEHFRPSKGGSKLRAREEINSHFAAGPQARWRGASDELYPGRYVRSEQQSQQGRSPQGRGGGRASALLPLLDDVRHRLRRGASHLPARRSRQNANLFLREPLVPYHRRGGGEGNGVRFQVQLHRGVGFEAILNEGFRQRVFDVFLDGSPEGARAVGSILAGLLNDPPANLRLGYDKELFLLHHIVQLVDQQIHNFFQVFVCESFKKDDLVQPVQELRVKYQAHFAVDHLLRILMFRLGCGEEYMEYALFQKRAQVLEVMKPIEFLQARVLTR